jgi:glycosyltransferase involved in cell wall biosynthesis
MPDRPSLSAVVITLNEEKNIARCLQSLSWVDEILVVDSGSTDQTKAIAEKMGAKVLHHAWQGYGQQKNWAMQQVKHSWVLFLDADEELGPGLRQEIEAFLANPQKHWGLEFPRRSWFLGRWIMHGGWYPNILTRLAHRDHSRWTEPAVHESLRVDGDVALAKSDILHYTFRDVGENVATNIRYSRLGAKLARERGEKSSLLRVIFRPIGKFFETYFWKMGFLDGFPGFVISVNAAHSIFMKYVELWCEKDSRN